MRARQLAFSGQHLHLDDSIERTLEVLRVHGRQYRHWVCAFSGGKDSTTVATLVAWAIAEGYVPPPETLLILMSDTHLELPPLRAQASRTLEVLRARGAEVRVVEPPIADRFYCYILGRGVPPPKSNFRWCTEELKIAPMMRELQGRATKYGERVLQILGERRGESVMRDQRIAARNGERLTPPAGNEPCATLCPILHWDVYLVWEWSVAFPPPRWRPSTAEIGHGQVASPVPWRAAIWR